MSSERRPSTGTCPECGKLCFLSKADAKRAIRELAGRKGRLSAYRCGAYWHTGHLPRAVVTGAQGRDDIAFGGRRPRDPYVLRSKRED